MKKSVSGSQSSPCLTQPLSSHLLLPAVPKPMLSSRFQVNPPNILNISVVSWTRTQKSNTGKKKNQQNTPGNLKI